MGHVPIGMTGDLAQRRPFSDPSFTRDHAGRRTLRRLEFVLRAIGGPASVGAPVEALVTSDPVLRNIVARLAVPLELGKEFGRDAHEIAVELVRALDAYDGTGTFSDRLALADVSYNDAAGETHAVLLWETPAGGGRLATEFNTTLAARVPPTQFLGAFSSPQAATVRSALQLLCDTIPEVATSMLAHVQVLCRLAPPDATGGILSSSFRDLSGIVFLSDVVLTSPLLVAEHILHEACHQRYGMISDAASVLCEGYDDAFGAKIVTPWHRSKLTSSVWGVDKALTAAHVYLYLAYFFGVLSDARPAQMVESEGIQRRFFSKLERCRFLLSALHATGRPQLGYAGNLMLDWMQQVAASFAVTDSDEVRLTRLLFERCAEEDADFFVQAERFAGQDYSADAERLAAFTDWLASLEPATMQRFEKCFPVGTVRPVRAQPGEPSPNVPADIPLVRYVTARRERARVMRELLVFAPDELARRTDTRAAIAFAQAESTNLNKFLDPKFRDRLVRRRAPQLGRTTDLIDPT